MVKIVDKLNLANSEAERAAILAELSINLFDYYTAHACLMCGLLPWFDKNIFVLLIKPDISNIPDIDLDFEFEKILKLPFVEKLYNRYVFHPLTKDGLYELYSEEIPTLMLGASKKFISQMGHMNNEKYLFLLVFCFIIGGMFRNANELINNLLTEHDYNDEMSEVLFLFKIIENANRYISKRKFKLSAFQYAMRGKANLRMGQYELAIADFEKAIEIQPNSSDYYAMRGYTFSKLNQIELALNDFNLAISLNPNDSWCYAQRGHIKSKLNFYNDAIEDLSKSIRIQPDFIWAYTTRGISYRHNGDYVKSINDLSRSLRAFPKDAWLLCQRGITYSHMWNIGKALFDFNKAIRVDSKNAWFYANRALIFRRLGKYRDAINDLDVSISIKENYVWAIASRGETYRLLRCFDLALIDLNQALELQKNDEWIYLFRAELFNDLGKLDLASIEISKVITLNKSNDWAFYISGIINYKKKSYRNYYINIDKAISIATLKFEKDKQDLQNLLNLGLYYLIENKNDDSNYYLELLVKKSKFKYLTNVFTRDIADILEIWPENKAAKRYLEKYGYIEEH